MITYTIKAKEKSTGNSLKTTIKAENEIQAWELFLADYKDSWDFESDDLVFVKPTKRYSYSIVGMGIFSLLSEFYEAGRVEIYDREDESGYAVDEASYFFPKSSMKEFYDFIDDLETDFPINLSFGNLNQCQKAVSEKLGIPVDKLNHKETMSKRRKQKNNEYLESLDPKERKRLTEKFGEWGVED